jgi:hypothetical protein
MDIAAWLQGLGLERYVPAFCDNEIDWEVLPKLTSGASFTASASLAPCRSSACRGTLWSPRLTDPDDAPAAPEHPVSQTGDLWLLGRHRLLCGDSTVATDVERVLGGVQPHLMVTEEPVVLPPAKRAA